jgi:hypothetical protein
MRVLPAEYDIVCQMQVIDREVFFYLAQRTDGKTGVVGDRVRVSRSGIALDISERMTPGKRGAVWAVTSDNVKDSIDRLVSIGLFKRLSKVGKGSSLVLSRVFLVDFLSEHYSVKKQVPQRFPDQLPDELSIIDNNINNIEENEATGSPLKTPEVPRTNNISTTTEAEKPFAMSIDWQPSENELRMILFRSVGSKHKIEDIDARWLGEFVGYWFSMTGRMMTQRQWTARYAANVVRYFSDPAMVARKFGGGVSGVAVGKQAAYEANSKALPDWARLPRGDEELVGWSKRFGFGDPEMGDGWIEFRAKLKQKINRRMVEANMAKVSW